jgi:ABC-type branched-subunit amino acid transport system substrate-binding protein
MNIGFADPSSRAFANVGAHGRRELQLVIEDINQQPS